jgi:hypothetical protein
VDDQWYRGRKVNGEEGIFPISFVEKVNKIKSCCALHQYAAQAADELTLCVGDEVSIIREMQGWYMGYNARGVSGMFPATFVELN